MTSGWSFLAVITKLHHIQRIVQLVVTEELLIYYLDKIRQKLKTISFLTFNGNIYTQAY